jgi:integrase
MNPTTCSLSQAVDYYLDTRRQWGFALKTEARTLRQLACYAEQQQHTGPLTTQLVLAWAQQPATADPRWWASRLGTARRFARFWVMLDPRTEVPPSGVFGPAGSRSPVHCYTTGQITQVLQLAGTLEPVDSLRPFAFQTLWGLLACTGLRIGEALRLQVADFDREAATLTIRRSKFGRSRCLPLQPSTGAALEAYLQRRQQYFPRTPHRHFFLSLTGHPLSYSQAEKTFRALRRQLGWHFTPQPRLYDLRHHFATERLLSWYQRGQTHLDQHIQTLATYLGHRQIRHTYWYLSAAPELLAVASARAAALGPADAGGPHD